MGGKVMWGYKNTHFAAIAITQAKDDGTNDRDDEMWPDLGYIFQLEVIRFTGSLKMAYKSRGINGDS